MRRDVARIVVFTAATAAVALTGCTTYLKHPVTGDTVKCEYVGGAPVPIAFAIQQSCRGQWQSRGDQVIEKERQATPALTPPPAPPAATAGTPTRDRVSSTPEWERPKSETTNFGRRD
jgi:hypothetical protein